MWSHHFWMKDKIKSDTDNLSTKNGNAWFNILDLSLVPKTRGTNGLKPTAVLDPPVDENSNKHLTDAVLICTRKKAILIHNRHNHRVWRMKSKLASVSPVEVGLDRFVERSAGTTCKTLVALMLFSNDRVRTTNFQNWGKKSQWKACNSETTARESEKGIKRMCTLSTLLGIFQYEDLLVLKNTNHSTPSKFRWKAIDSQKLFWKHDSWTSQKKLRQALCICFWQHRPAADLWHAKPVVEARLVSSPPGLLTFGAKNLNLRSSEIFSQTHGERVLSLAAEKHGRTAFFFPGICNLRRWDVRHVLKEV